MAKYLNLDGLQTLWTKIMNTFAKKDDLAEVATSGDYGDLSNKPPELFYCYYDVTTAMEIEAAISNKKTPILVESTTNTAVKGYYCGSRNGIYYFESADNPPDPRDPQYIKEKMWFYVSGSTWSTKNVPLYAEKADRATIADSASSVEVGARISARGSNFHDTQYALVVTSTEATSAAQISCYRFNNGSSSNNSPFSDGMVINIPWSSRFGVQIAIDDESNTEYKRYLNNGTWSSWVQTMTSDGYAASANQATKAQALTSRAGSMYQPCYIDSDGKPKTCEIWFS